MKEIIESIVKNLVDKPDEVRVTETSGEKTVCYELKVGDGDLGMVIGKHGQIVRSIRTLVAAVSAKHGKRSVFDILE